MLTTSTSEVVETSPSTILANTLTTVATLPENTVVDTLPALSLVSELLPRVRPPIDVDSANSMLMPGTGLLSESTTTNETGSLSLSFQKTSLSFLPFHRFGESEKYCVRANKTTRRSTQ